MKRLVFLITIALVVGALGLATPAASHDADHQAEIELRDRLIGSQEQLLNVYRCALEVDLELVPGGCSEPPRQLDPAVFTAGPNVDFHAEIELRDRLIGQQEKLLNVYRCMLGADLELVPGACSEPPARVGQWAEALYAAQGTDPPIPIVWGYQTRAQKATTQQRPILRLVCDTVRYPTRGIIVEIHWYFTQFVSNTRLTVPFTYTVAGETHTEEWPGDYNFESSVTLLLPFQAQYTAFVSRLAGLDGGELRIELDDINGRPASAEFDLHGVDDALLVLNSHC